jgi:hypothetical protein
MRSVPLKALLVASALSLVLASPALAGNNFGQVTLKAGETQTVSIFGFGGYQSVRVCNDSTSASNVKVTIRPRDSQVLQPGLCTQNTGDQIEFVNQGGGQALVSYNPAPGGGYGSGFGMFGNNFRVFGN